MFMYVISIMSLFLLPEAPDAQGQDYIVVSHVNKIQ